MTTAPIALFLFAALLGCDTASALTVHDAERAMRPVAHAYKHEVDARYVSVKCRSTSRRRAACLLTYTGFPWSWKIVRFDDGTGVLETVGIVQQSHDGRRLRATIPEVICESPCWV